MPDTVAAEFNGRCVEHCWDVHGVAIRLGDAWQTHEITWDQLQQAGWGKPVRFDPQHLLSLELAASPANLPADFWIDDLEWLAASAAK